MIGGVGVSWWSWLKDLPNHVGVQANANDPAPPPGTVANPDWNPGDPDGVTFEESDVEPRAFAQIMPSPWSGWPAEWSTPAWAADPRFTSLVDTAWSCLDLNSSVLSTMPVYRTRNGRVLSPTTWMSNPDPDIYTSWHEFAKQLFWDYQMGEAFVLPTDFNFDAQPSRFRVIPPWMVNVDMDAGRRTYHIGSLDVTGVMLHIRYKSSTESPRGVGPLESGGARLTAAAVLSRYMTELVKGGGVPYLTLETDVHLDKDEADDLRQQWYESRMHNLGKPAVLHSGVRAQAHQMSPKDMAMLELAQFNESRIAILLGVPPFLVGLPSGGDSMTYSNVSSLFDFHDRSSIRPKATHVMAALSGWALPHGQTVELNRDEYSRPAFNERVNALVQLHTAGVISTEELRRMERFTGDASAEALTGGGNS